MTTHSNPNSLSELEQRIAELIALARRLSEENRMLRLDHEKMASERKQLLSKNELARARVEAMISRLKGLEQNS